MPRGWAGQTSFNAGVLDPRMNARHDLDLYYQGAKTAANVLSLPHGGMKRRPGMKYHATMQARSRMLPFEFNTEQTYEVAISAARIDIYSSGTLKDSITSSVPYTEDQCFELDYAQSGDTMLLFHKDVQTQVVTRVGDTNWTIAAVTYTNIPQYDFNDASSPTAVAEEQDMTFNAAFNNGDTYKLELEGLESDTITYSSATADNETRIADALQDLTNTGNTGISVAHQSGTTYRVTLDGESAKDWELLAGRPISIASASPAIITVAAVTDGTARSEDSWSNTRGWPRTGTFFDGRLWVGGSDQLPVNMWGSRIFNYFDFKLAKGRDDDAVSHEMNTEQLNVIQHIVAGRDLQVFTSGGEFYVPSDVITPENMATRRQTRYGSRQVRPVIIDGATVYAQRKGTALREFIFTDEENAYVSPPINIRAPHLFNDVTDMAATGGTSNEDANYIYVVNGDGTMAVFNTLREESIAAWTPWETDGEIQSICVTDQVLWFCVKRTINSATVYYLEEANVSHRLDASVLGSQASSETVTGLSHLDGESCRIRQGNVILADVTPSSGSVTAEIEVTTPEVGLDVAITLTPMPVVQAFPNGRTAPRLKRLVRSVTDVKDTLGIYIGGYLFKGNSFDVTFGADITAYTGQIETTHDDGWVQELELPITQPDPLPFEVLSIYQEVAA